MTSPFSGNPNIGAQLGPKLRYRVVFTPAGWQVVDTSAARDAVAEFGLGRDEYERAQERAASLNEGPA